MRFHVRGGDSLITPHIYIVVKHCYQRQVAGSGYRSSFCSPPVQVSRERFTSYQVLLSPYPTHPFNPSHIH